MTAGVRVARDKKPAGGKPAGESEAKEPVKLRATFKKRLQRVAQDAGLDMGELIERQMADYINREYKRLLQEDLKELQDG